MFWIGDSFKKVILDANICRQKIHGVLWWARQAQLHKHIPLAEVSFVSTSIHNKHDPERLNSLQPSCTWWCAQMFTWDVWLSISKLFGTCGTMHVPVRAVKIERPEACHVITLQQVRSFRICCAEYIGTRSHGKDHHFVLAKLDEKTDPPTPFLTLLTLSGVQCFRLKALFTTDQGPAALGTGWFHRG